MWLKVHVIIRFLLKTKKKAQDGNQVFYSYIEGKCLITTEQKLFYSETVSILQTVVN